jgi:hypothetical protein
MMLAAQGEEEHGGLRVITLQRVKMMNVRSARKSKSSERLFPALISKVAQ